MVSVCTVPARGGRSCEHFGGYKTINRIPLNDHPSNRFSNPIEDGCNRGWYIGTKPIDASGNS